MHFGFYRQERGGILVSRILHQRMLVTTKNSVGRPLNEVSRTRCPLRPGSNVGPRESLDWEKELIYVTRPKVRRQQFYPLSRTVWEAILHYLKARTLPIVKSF